MLTTTFLLAAANPASPAEDAIREAAGRSKPFWGGEISLILGAVLIVAALVFFWAIFLRKRPETQRGSFVISRARTEDPERHGSSGRRRRRKRKDDHPDNLPRNPTIAEIGGLPPPRADDPEPPGQGEASPSPGPQR